MTKYDPYAETKRLMALLHVPLDRIAHMERAATRAVAETQANLYLEERLKTEPEIKIGTELFTRPQGKPDRPGTVRRPGVRVEHRSQTKRYQRWSDF